MREPQRTTAVTVCHSWNMPEHPPSEEGLVRPGGAIQFSYGALSVSSASTRQERSSSRTRNGGWYSNAVSIGKPGLFLWCRNQITAETPMIATTVRMTMAVSSALGPWGEQGTTYEEGHHWGKQESTEEWVKRGSTYSAWLPRRLKKKKKKHALWGMWNTIPATFPEVTLARNLCYKLMDPLWILNSYLTGRPDILAPIVNSYSDPSHRPLRSPSDPRSWHFPTSPCWRAELHTYPRARGPRGRSRPPSYGILPVAHRTTACRHLTTQTDQHSGTTGREAHKLHSTVSQHKMKCFPAQDLHETWFKVSF